MAKSLIVFIIWLLFSCSLIAKNVVYVVAEGVSRYSLYDLIKKGNLPNYNQLIQRGNYRNLGIKNKELSGNESTYITYSGSFLSQYSDFTFYQKVKQLLPELEIRCFLSTPIMKNYKIPTEAFLNILIEDTSSNELGYKASLDIGKQAASFIRQHKGPFFLVLNYTNVDYIGWRYREGADLYSKAIKNTDTSLGYIINALKETGQFSNTEFLLTTNYGYHKKMQLRKAEGWVVSTQKSLRKGNLMDIFPSLLDLLELSDTDYYHSLSGKSLFRSLNNTNLTFLQ